MNTFILSQFHRRPYQVIAAVAILLGLVITGLSAEPNTTTKQSPADIVRSCAAQGKLAYKLTESEEIKALLGPALNESTKTSGGMEVLFLEYPGVKFIFGRMREWSAPFTLMQVTAGGRDVDIGQSRQITLRNENDLKKFDTFWGLANVSLVNLDLRQYKELLDDMPFDSLTKWPEPNKMPKGFEPVRLLEEGKNPGLGIRRLHEQGIDGKGIGIAIIDQPLLKEHIEYTDRLVRYEPIDVQGVPVQMHGPPVASIAVGKTCGVAPGASLVYYAIPAWKWNSCRPYCDIINKILELNKTLKDSEKIRVVSISQGMFSKWSDFIDWKKTVEKAAGEGILIVTCDSKFLDYGTIVHITDKNPDEPTSYKRGKYSAIGNVLLIPAGNRTIASQLGPEVYTFDREGGMSWAAPYLAGLAALAFQVDPEIKPDEIVNLWKQTAVTTDAGPIVNPIGFIDAVRKIRAK